jgi:arylsulfatase A-like enzyme
MGWEDKPTRREVAQSIAAVGLGVLAGPKRLEAAQKKYLGASRKPNILFILSDQHRHDALGIAGDPVIQTPSLDGMAREGTLFKRMWCQSPVCRPARAALITGRYPHQNGIAHNSDAYFDPAWPTLMKNLQAAGYETASFGKTDYRGNKGDRSIETDLRNTYPYLRSFGFDHVTEDGGLKLIGREGFRSPYVDYLRAEGLLERYARLMDSSGGPGGERESSELWEPAVNNFDQNHDLTSFVAHQVIDWLETRNTSRPFYVTFAPLKPHGPLAADPVWAAYYKDKDVPLGPRKPAILRGDIWSIWLEAHYRTSNAAHLDDAYVLRCKRIYYAMISLVDQKIGEIIDALRKQGELENTWIIYSSDHGDMMGDHNLMNKEVFYDASVCVPAIIRPSQGQNPQVVDRPVEAIDLTAAILEIAGAASLPATASQSLLSQLENSPRLSKTNQKAHAFSEISNKNDSVFFVAVNDGRYRYTVETKSNTPCELFDLHEDPNEDVNLVGDPGNSSRVAKMQRELITPHLSGQMRN